MKPLSPVGRLLVASAAAIVVMWLLGFLGSLAAGPNGMLSACERQPRPIRLRLLVTAIAMSVGGCIAGKRFIGVAFALMCVLWLAIVLMLVRMAGPAQPGALAQILSYNGLQITLSMLAACAGAASRRVAAHATRRGARGVSRFRQPRMTGLGAPQAALFVALVVLWACSELWLAWKRRSQDRSRMRDAGTLRLLLVTVYACIGMRSGCRSGRPATSGTRRSAQPLFWAGLLLMAGGLALRFWAIRVLARFFTIDVNIQEGHELIRRGPYRWLRHPSYTGSLMTFLGFGLALGNVWSLLVLMAPVTLAFIWRMRVEERVLAEAFPDQYPDYARQTKRLIPFVW